MTMISCKYYDIYKTYPFKVSWRPGSLVESGGSRMALCSGVEFGQRAE
jgi:hypothetical protein